MNEKGKRGIPAKLREVSGGRTSASLAAVLKVIEDLKKDMVAGFIQQRTPISLKSVQAKAGVNERFLYGNLHKLDMKPKVQDFVDEFNRALASKLTDEPKVREKMASEADYWKERYLKLSARTNGWFHRMRNMQRELKDIKIKTGTVIEMK